MENIVNMPRPEILMVADTVAREKNIDREDVFKAMEEAIQKAGRSKYGFEHDIRVNINRKTGAITLARYRAVVDVIENETHGADTGRSSADKPGHKSRRIYHRPSAAD